MKDESGITDERLDALLNDAREGYRVPADPPLDAMWARIEREAFDAPRESASVRRAWGRWLPAAAGIAATLLVGVGIGRYAAPPVESATLPAALDSRAQPAADPLVRTASRYLDDAASLLAALPRDVQNVDARFVGEAQQLLSTTRVLLDSPVGSDPRLEALLEDLELVLAQVASLRAAGRAEDLNFIAAAMNEREVVPRIRTVAAVYSTSDYRD